MYEVTVYVGTQAVAGFDNLSRWSQVKDAVKDLEGRYDLSGWDNATRCVVRFSDRIRTVVGWATGSATMERPLVVEGMLESYAEYTCLVWDTENAERIADDLPYARVYDLTAEYYDVLPAYVGGYDRERVTLIHDTIGKRVVPI
jgi:hypothetical protein